MTDVIARIRIKGKEFEIVVDCEKAIQFRKGSGRIEDVLITPTIFIDSKKGLKPSEADLEKSFNTTDVYNIAAQIIKQGEIQLPTEYKAKQRELKLKQIVDFIATNCIDSQTKKPHPPERIAEAIKQAGVKIDEKRSAEDQSMNVIKEIQKILPIRIETKRLKIKIPATYTGRTYALLKDFLEKEEWLSDGSFSCIINIPVGAQLTFFDKLNSITHGAAITQELENNR